MTSAGRNGAGPARLNRYPTPMPPDTGSSATEAEQTRCRQKQRPRRATAVTTAGTTRSPPPANLLTTVYPGKKLASGGRFFRERRADGTKGASYASPP